jgi:hypothetical protein
VNPSPGQCVQKVRGGAVIACSIISPRQRDLSVTQSQLSSGDIPSVSVFMSLLADCIISANVSVFFQNPVRVCMRLCAIL